MTTGDNTTKTTRVHGPQLERNGDVGGGSGSDPPPPPTSKLEAARAKLCTPLATSANPSALEAELEAHRLLLLQQADEISAAKRQLEITTREYNTAHGFTPAGDGPSRVGEVRHRGGALGGELDRDGESTPIGSMGKPVYSTPVKNMRAVSAAAKELSRLEGEELRRQTERVAELLCIATEQQNDPRYAGNIPSGSLAHEPAGGAKGGPRDTMDSSSPHPS
jgi:hypothetical protein